MSLGFPTQAYLADPLRGDGRGSDGTPGDCVRASVAGIFFDPLSTVPHFALYHSWWDTLRRWSRERYTTDWAFFEREDYERHAYPAVKAANTPRLMGCGKSPRGDFLHAVIVDPLLNLIHDPHPSREGLAGEVLEVFVPAVPYWPAPHQLQLT